MKGKGKHWKNKWGKFCAAVNDMRQVLPPASPPAKKPKAPKLPPSANGDTSTQHNKVLEPTGLVFNWRQNVGTLTHIAQKHPVEFANEGDDLIQGDFDKPEGSALLNAIRAFKNLTVRIDMKLVSDLILCDWTYLEQYNRLGWNLPQSPFSGLPMARGDKTRSRLTTYRSPIPHTV